MKSSPCSKRFFLFVAVVAGIGLGACASPPPDQGTDLLLLNGRVYSFDWDEPAVDGSAAANAPHSADGWSPDAEAVAISDGRIVFVGTNDEAESYRGESTRVMDLKGATVIPGLVDSHTHVVGLGQLEVQVNLIGVASEQEAIQRVVEGVGEVPAGEWIVARGWDEGAWANHYPTMEALSEAFPENPVVMNSLHGFATWGNRLAFERAGIDRDRVAPEGGEILKDAEGNPTGILLNRAGSLLRDAIPEATEEQMKSTLVAGLDRMARDGYVAVHEAGVGTDMMVALQSLNAAGELPIRVYNMLSARDEPLCREWIQKGPDPIGESMLITRSVKAYYDGALGSRGARLLYDYEDRPGYRGVAGNEYGFDEGLVEELMKAGFQVGIHAIGDAGNRETLDFFQRVIETTPQTGSLRHRIEHAQVLHPDDFARFAEMNIIASMEPPHAVEDKLWAEERLGPERVLGAYAWRTLRQAGARLVFNSDLAGSDHDIFYGLHAAITRRDEEEQPPDGWHPEQNMTPEEALRGYTVWAAYAGFLEEETGLLAPGRWGDVTVMDIDPMVLGEADPGAILDGKIVATIVGGKVVYQAN